MVDLYDSRAVIRKLHFEQNKQFPDLNKNTFPKFHYEFVSLDASKVNPHLFIVDWQIQESEEDKVFRDFLSA